MKVLGIIAEYDPFHNGHQRMMQDAKEQTQADYIICVISSAFLQRGCAAMFSTYTRAKMALVCGADIVLAMPFSFSCAPAHRFALGGVGTLHSLGIVTDIAFGVERSAFELFLSTRESSLPDFRKKTKKGEALARKRQHLDDISDNAQTEWNKPNLALALCYEDAIKKLGSKIRTHPIPRDVDYHDPALKSIASASAIRLALSRGQFEEIKIAVPESSFDIILEAVDSGNISDKEKLDDALFTSLLFADPSELTGIAELIEGLDNKLSKSFRFCKSKDELVLQLKSKRYTYTRLARGLTNVMLQVKDESLPALPDYARLMGFSDRALPLLKMIKSNGFPLLSSLANMRDAGYTTDVKSEELWYFSSQNPISSAYTNKIIKTGR